MPRGLAALLATFLIFLAAPARAWVEWHHTGEEVRAELTEEGTARFEHAVRYRVVMGPLKYFDVSGIDAEAQLEAEGNAKADDGRTFALHVEPLPKRGEDRAAERTQTLRVYVDEPKGLKRGSYTFWFRYRLETKKLLTKDGAWLRFGWTAPPALEGFDNGKLTLVVPTAGAEPQPAGEASGTQLFTVRRGANVDEIEIVRPHVTKAESSVWSARIDPHAFPALVKPEERKVAPKPLVAEHRLDLLALGLGALGLAAVLFLAMRKKIALVAGRPLLGLPAAARPALVAASFGLGLVAQGKGHPGPGLAAVALAILLAVERPPQSRARSSRWLALRPEDAFRAPPSSWFDATSLRGGLLVSGFAMVAAGLAFVSTRLGPDTPFLVLADASIVVPLFFTGHHPRTRAALRRLFGMLRARAELRVAPVGSLYVASEARGLDSSERDVRLLVKPKGAMPGLLGIEASAASGLAVCVRVRDGSPSESRLRALLPEVSAMSGRDSDERAMCFSRGTVAGTAELIATLGEALAERRNAAGAFRGQDRRAA